MIRLLLFIFFVNCFFAEDTYQGIGSWPVQDQGRLKPLDTYVRELAYEVYGKETPLGQHHLHFFLSLFDSPEKVNKLPIVAIDNFELKKELGLEPKTQHFSLGFFASRTDLEEKFSAVRKKGSMKEKLTPRDEALKRLEFSLNALSATVSGELNLIPPHHDSHTWTALIHASHLDPELIKSFFKMASGFNEHRPADFQSGAKEFQSKIAQVRPLTPKEKSTFQQELIYNEFKPFRKAAIFYGLALLFCLFLFKLPQSQGLKIFAQCLFWVAFVLQTHGLGLRVYILERPPVSNMYESVIFMAWTASLIFLITSFRRFQPLYLATASFCGFMTLVLANLLPMNSALGVLEAVLRSNYWLIIHVMTIVASYAGFTLAVILAHIWLVLKWLDLAPATRDIAFDLMLNAIRIGTLLVGVGLILGGVWANESWGRFWGWDPKETWALITFLAYIALLHARKADKIGRVGLAIGALINFILVVMTWYGVNYIIGVGLHSYGFGSGGTHFFWIFMATELSLALFFFLKLSKASELPLSPINADGPKLE